MTPAEQRKLVELETRIKTKLGSKMEADLAIGGALLQIQRESLHRGPDGGRKFEDYIKQDSHRLTPDNQPIGVATAERLRGFYYFREEVLHSDAGRRGSENLPPPTSAYQVRPLLFLLDHLRRDSEEIRSGSSYDDRRAAEAKAIEIWKAAVTEARGKAPTFDQVNRARFADKAAAEQHRLRGRANSTAPFSKPTSPPIAQVPCAPPTREEIMDKANFEAREDGQPLPFPELRLGQSPRMFMNNEATWPSDMKRDVAAAFEQPSAPAAAIPAWELEKEDGTLDAGAECKRITRAITDAHKAIGLLRGILYSQINKHGSDYLGVLRQVDAGVYSLHSIDDQVQQMADDIAFISGLLIADVGEGELARSTVDVSAMPTRA